MPPRKTTPRKKKDAEAAKPAGLPTPSASFGGWQSVGQTRLRRGIYNGPAQDLRRDMKPSDRLTMVKRCRWAERNSGLFKQILNDLVLYTVGDGIKPQSHAADPALADPHECLAGHAILDDKDEYVTLLRHQRLLGHHERVDVGLVKGLDA